MNIKTFIFGFIVVYLLISLSPILGIGYVIDWVREATFLQKFMGSVIEGLTNNYFMKIVISVIVSTIFNLFLPKRKQSK